MAQRGSPAYMERRDRLERHIKKEQDAAKHTYFTTTFGKRISLYDDLYTIPEDPEEAENADMGIYFDEPNIFDFLDWLSQEKSHSKQ